ncbi:MAG: glycoside hydrolase family 13 protein [Anaerolineae bacterium]|nr:glycoside hydrolase family 13 protein [Anaerolineae bacterium]
MKQRSALVYAAALASTLLVTMLALLLNDAAVYGASIAVDGVVDADYGPPVASDPPDDGNGNAVMDLLDLYIAEDADYYYFAFTINANIAATNWGKYIIYIDTTNDEDGATSDAWTRNVVVNEPHEPEYGIYSWVDSPPYNTGHIQFRRWTGSGWTSEGETIAGAALSTTGVTSTIEWQLARSAIGDVDAFWCEVWSTGGGSTDNAQDTINAPADDWNATNWSTTAVLSNSTPFARSYFGPSLNIAVPQEGQHVIYAGLVAQGTVSPTTGVSITIDLNGTARYTPTLDAEGAFTQPLTLVGGQNAITFTAQNISGTVTTVRHVTLGPALTLSAPTEGAHFVAPATVPVAGIAQPAEDVTVTIQLDSSTPITAPVDPSTGAFSATVAPGSDGWHTLTVTAANTTGSATAVRHVTYGAAGQDGEVWWGCLGHFTRDDAYREPWGAQPAGSTVTFRLRTCAGDLTGATFHAWPANLAPIVAPMTVSTALTDPLGMYDYWEISVTLPVTPHVLFYKFEAVDGADADWYIDDVTFDGRNGWGQPFDNDGGGSLAFDLTAYDPSFTTPDWIQNGIVYQIFPDRFRNGDPTNDVVSGTHPFYDNLYGGWTYPTWNSPVYDPRDPSDPHYFRWSEDFYGGDLQGVIDQLDYLEGLGVTALYLNPSFWSPSNHKYDTTDFGQIDPHMGDLATLQALVAAAEQRGMVIVFDGVFNHTSSDSVYFDRYGRYDALGACEDPASPYRDWFRFTDVTPGTGTCVGSTGISNAATYDSWWGYDTLPTLDSENPAVQAYFWGDGDASIGGRWVVSGTHGWRLDVGGDVDSGAWYEPGNGYWEGFRATVKAANPDAVIFGEEWGDARSWLLGTEWDSVMNYRFRSALLSFMRDEVYWDNDNNSGSSGGTLEPITVSAFDRWLHQIEEDYPPEAWYAMVNLMGSHDTNRVRFVLSKWQIGYDDTDPAGYDPATDFDPEATDRRQMLMALLQFTLPGAPTIYYGDEVGITSPGGWYGDKWEDDPYNRVPFPWSDTPGAYTARSAVHDHYAQLGHIRNAHPALRTGTFDTLLVDDTHAVYAFGRTLGITETAVVVVNRGITEQTVTVPLAGYVPDGTLLTDHLNRAYYTVSGGEITLTVAPEWGAVLTTTPERWIYLPLVMRES